MLKNTSIKILLLTIVIIASYTLPQIAQKEDKAKEDHIFGVWKKFDQARLKELVDKGDVVLVSISADWCLTCKYNEFMVLNRSTTLKLFKDTNAHAMRGDITNHDPILQHYMMSQDAVGIPLYVIYGPAAKKGIKLPVLISYKIIADAIKHVSE